MFNLHTNFYKSNPSLDYANFATRREKRLIFVAYKPFFLTPFGVDSIKVFV